MIDLLLNRKIELVLGYHAVKCRGQRDLDTGVSIETGVENEKDFFETHDKWRHVDSTFLGVENLRTKLVDLLDDAIERGLPSVMQEVRTRIDSTRLQLDSLGADLQSTSSQRSYFFEHVEVFSKTMASASEGTYHAPTFDSKFFDVTNDSTTDNRLRALLSLCNADFRTEIENVQVKDQFVKNESVPKVEDFVEVYDEGIWRTVEVKSIDSDSFISLVSQSTVKYLYTDVGKYWRWPSTLDLTELKEKLKSNRSDQLPIFPSYPVFCACLRDYINRWEGPIDKLFESYRKIILAQVQRVIAILPKASQPLIKGQVTNELAYLFRTTQVSIQKARETEYRPFTANHYCMFYF